MLIYGLLLGKTHVSVLVRRVAPEGYDDVTLHMYQRAESTL